MALVQSNGMALGTSAPDFSLPGVDGKDWSLSDFSGARALVVVFTCNHCPYAIAAEDRLNDLAGDYAERGVRVVAINPNDAEHYAADSFEAMKARAADKGFRFPYLVDATQEIARAYDAACTPDIFLFDADRTLVYNGRLDDNWQDAAAVTRTDLRSAIDATLASRPFDFDVIASMGCSIKWK